MNFCRKLLTLIIISSIFGGVGCVQTTYENTPDQAGTESPDLRLELNSQINESIRIEIARKSDTGMVLNETYPPEVGMIKLSDEMEDGIDYRVTIKTTDQVLWQENIHKSEGYKLLIHEDGSVSIEAHDES
jgi:hypothetical protein